MAPLARCAFVGLGVKLEDGLEEWFQRAPHVLVGRDSGSPSGQGLPLNAPASPAPGREVVTTVPQGG